MATPSPSYLQRRYGVVMRRILRKRAQKAQRDFERRLEEVVSRRPDTPRALEASVYSYCGAKSFLDQVVTLRSFLRNIGAPKKFVVVSDGTLNAVHKAQLVANHPCVQCQELGELDVSPPPELAALVEEKMPNYYLARKLLLLVAISARQQPTLYADSDVLFFPASDVSPLLDFSGELWCLKDCMWALDSRLVTAQTQEGTSGITPVNSGFCLFGRAPEWEKAFEPLRAFDGELDHVSEQTLVHNMMHFNDARELPTDRFRLQIEDQYRRDDFALLRPTVLRHYVGFVRHKMWLHAPVFYT